MSKQHVEERSDALRPRIIEALRLLGEANGKPNKEARSAFVRTAITLGKARGMRTWKTTDDAIGSPLKSLRVILKENGTMQADGTYATGRNNHWALDLWELAVDHLLGAALGSPASEHEENVRAAARASHRAQVAMNIERSPQHPLHTMTGIVQEPRPASMGEQLLSAYIKRDDDAILEIAERLRDQ